MCAQTNKQTHSLLNMMVLLMGRFGQYRALADTLEKFLKFSYEVIQSLSGSGSIDRELHLTPNRWLLDLKQVSSRIFISVNSLVWRCSPPVSTQEEQLCWKSVMRPKQIFLLP